MSLLQTKIFDELETDSYKFITFEDSKSSNIINLYGPYIFSTLKSKDGKNILKLILKKSAV